MWLENLISILSPYKYIIFALAALLIILLFVLVIILFTRQQRLFRRMNYFMRGSDTESLESTLRRVVDDNKQMRIQLKNNVDEIVKINENLLTSYRKLGIVKFNAFPGMTGKVSSSIALLNNENNGIVITSIHGQEGCYTYVKEIMNGKSISPLTKEDEEALKIALQMQI